MNLRLFILSAGEDLLIIWPQSAPPRPLVWYQIVIRGPSLFARKQITVDHAYFGLTAARTNITNSYEFHTRILYPAAGFIVRQINCLIHINFWRRDGIPVSVHEPLIVVHRACWNVGAVILRSRQVGARWGTGGGLGETEWWSVFDQLWIGSMLAGSREFSNWDAMCDGNYQVILEYNANNDKYYWPRDKSRHF